jgi:hypothetical protein
MLFLGFSANLGYAQYLIIFKNYVITFIMQPREIQQMCYKFSVQHCFEMEGGRTELHKNT